MRINSVLYKAREFSGNLNHYKMIRTLLYEQEAIALNNYRLVILFFDKRLEISYLYLIDG